MAFLQGQYEHSQALLSQAEVVQRKKDQSSYSKLFADLTTKTFTRGGYQPMFRDRFMTHFYLALDYLALEQVSKAQTEMRKMLRLMDKLSMEWERLPDREELSEVSEELGQPNLQGRLQQYQAATRAYWNLADTGANWQLARFYHPAALLLAAFLEGCRSGDTEEFRYACRLVDESRFGQRTVLQLLNGVNGGLAGKLLVIAAVGKGPVLAERKVGVTGAQLISFTSLPKERDNLMKMNGPQFNPENAVLLNSTEAVISTEMATSLYSSLAADFALRESRLYWEQIIRVVVRDLLVEGVILAGSSVADDSKTSLWVTILGNITWFFARQTLMTPDLRCQQRSPWCYQVALMEIPDNRKLTCKLGDEQVEVTLPANCKNAVLYLDCHGYSKDEIHPILLPIR